MFKKASIFSQFVIFILIISLISLHLSGCYTHFTGDFVRNGKIAGSEKIIGFDYEIKKLEGPSINDPQIGIIVNSIPRYKVNTVAKHREIEKRPTTVTTITVVVLSAGLLYPLLYLLMLFPPKTTQGDDGGFIWYPTERLVDGKRDSTIEYGTPIALKSTVVEVRYNNLSKVFTTDDDGKITVDLINDLSLTSFSSPSDIKLKLISHQPKIEQEITINPTDWTRPFYRVNENKVPVRQTNSTKVKILTKISALEEYPIVNKGNEYHKIKVGDTEGWVTANSGTVFWSIPERFNPKNPPSISIASVKLTEPSSDNILDAEESGNILLEVSNTGKGLGYRLTAKTTQIAGSNSYITYQPTTSLGTLQAGEMKEYKIPVTASLDIKSEQVKFKVEVIEANGFDADPVDLTFETRAFRSPDLIIADQGIDDASGNGIIELGEAVDVTARIQNQGQGEAKNVAAAINVADEGQNIFYHAPSKNFTVGTLKSGEYQDVKFTIVTNKRFTGNKLPVNIALNEKRVKFNKVIPLSLPLSRPIKRTEEFIVKGNEQTPSSLVQMNQLTVDIEENIPRSTIKNPDAVAVVIGISRYKNTDVPSVDYANRGATIMKKYLTDIFGYDERRIIFADNENASLGDFKRIFEEQLRNYIKPGKSDLFIYYNGHGAPDPETKEAFFVPYDCNPTYAKSTGYPLKEFYNQLAKLPAKSITVIIDACFSGSSPKGMLLKQVSPVFITVEEPIMAIDNGFLFASSTGQQLSNWYPEKKHGLFTYYFLKGLKGDADKNGDKQISVDEIEEYLLSNVPEQARYLNNREQTPQVMARDKKRVLVKF